MYNTKKFKKVEHRKVCSKYYSVAKFFKHASSTLAQVFEQIVTIKPKWYCPNKFQ